MRERVEMREGENVERGKGEKVKIESTHNHLTTLSILHISSCISSIVLGIGIDREPEIGSNRGHIAEDVEQDKEEGHRPTASTEIGQKH